MRRVRHAGILGLLGVVAATTSGCVQYGVNTYTFHQVDVPPTTTPALLVEFEGPRSAKLFLKVDGGPGVRVGGRVSRESEVWTDSLTGDYPYLFPVLLPVDLLTLIVSAPLAGIEALFTSTGEAPLPERELSPGETLWFNHPGSVWVSAGSVSHCLAAKVSILDKKTTLRLTHEHMDPLLDQLLLVALQDPEGRAELRLRYEEDVSPRTFAAPFERSELLERWGQAAQKRAGNPVERLDALTAEAQVHPAARDPLSQLRRELHEAFEVRARAQAEKERQAHERGEKLRAWRRAEQERKEAERRRRLEEIRKLCSGCGGSGVASRGSTHERVTAVTDGGIVLGSTRHSFSHVDVWMFDKRRGEPDWRVTFSGPVPKVNAEGFWRGSQLRFNGVIAGTQRHLPERDEFYPRLCQTCKGTGERPKNPPSRVPPPKRWR